MTLNIYQHPDTFKEILSGLDDEKIKEAAEIALRAYLLRDKSEPATSTEIRNGILLVDRIMELGIPEELRGNFLKVKANLESVLRDWEEKRH